MLKTARTHLWPDRKRKPPFGSVEIDWRHQLAQGLVGYLLFNEAGGLPVDLVHPSQRADLLLGTWSADSRGLGVKTVSANDRIRFPAPGTDLYSIGGDKAFSVSWQFTKTGQSGSGADGYVAHRTAFGAAGLWEVYDDNTNLQFGTESATGIGLGPKPTNGIPHTVTVTRQAGGSYTCYIDRAINGTGSNTNAISSGSQRLVVGTIGEDVPGLNIFATWGWVAIHRAALAQKDHQWLCVEPYDFLRPKIIRRYFIPSGGPIAVALGQVTETDLAQTFTRRKAKAFSQLLETDLAQTVTTRKTLTLGQAIEAAIAQPLSHSQPHAIAAVLESDVAQPMQRVKRLTLGLAVEVDQARAMLASGGASGGGPGTAGSGILRTIRG